MRQLQNDPEKIRSVYQNHRSNMPPDRHLLMDLLIVLRKRAEGVGQECTDVIVGRALIPPRMASMLNRERSLSNLCRTSADSFAKQMRPKVAAVAATTVSGTRSMLGIVRPMNDIAVQVGGGNAGKRFRGPRGWGSRET